MRTYIAVLVLIFSFQSWIKADDIRDFQIEGISIGDSLLDYFNEKDIKNNVQNWYNDNEYELTEIYNPPNYTEYDSLKFHYKSKDQKYKIVSIGGINFYKNEISQCHNDMKKIDNEISFLFKNLKRNTENQIHPADKSGKSKTKAIRYWFKDKSLISIVCYDWSEKASQEHGWTDNLQLEISLKEFNNWLQYKAYK